MFAWRVGLVGFLLACLGADRLVLAQSLSLPDGWSTMPSPQLMDWVSKNPWQNLALADEMQLARRLLDDRMGRNAYSVRWTGTITPAQNGNYRFGLLRSVLLDPPCRITVNNVIVYDTITVRTDGRNPYDFIDHNLASALLGNSINLPARAAVPILVEYVNDEVEGRGIGKTTTMTLMWEQPDLTISSVPAAALQPSPDAMAGAGAQGLWGSYFNAQDFTQPVDQRLDPSLDFFWYWAPILPKCPQYLAIVSDCVRRLTTPNADGTLPSLALDRDVQVFGMNFYDLLNYEQRLALYDFAVAQPNALQLLDANGFAALYRSLGVLASGRRLNLLKAWGAVRSFPTLQPLSDPAPAGFNGFNHLGYAISANNLLLAFAPDFDRLMQDGLWDPQGRPQVEVVCVAAHAAPGLYRVNDLRSLIRSQFALQTWTGDDLAKWEITFGYTEEWFSGEVINPAIALEHFQRAADAAQSPDAVFHAKGELIARLVYLGDATRATPLLDSLGGIALTADQQSLLTSYRAQLAKNQTQLPAYEQQQFAAQQQAASAAYQAELTNRAAQARAQGDLATATRFEQQVQQLSNANTVK